MSLHLYFVIIYVGLCLSTLGARDFSSAVSGFLARFPVSVKSL